MNNKSARGLYYLAVLILFAAFLAAGITGSVKFKNRHIHDWQTADCLQAAFCAGCGEYRGEIGDHTWVEATCEAPKTCAVCGMTEGEALGHEWIEKSVDAPKHCKVCGLEEGEKLHRVVISDWGYDELFYFSEDYLIAHDGDKYFLVDYEGNLMEEGALGDEIPVMWDYVYRNLQGGAIAAGCIADGKHTGILLSKDLDIIYKTKDSDFYIRDYRDDILTLYSASSVMMMTLESDAFYIFDNIEYKFIGFCSYGYVVMSYVNVDEESGNCFSLMRMDIDGSDFSDVVRFIDYEDMKITFNRNSVCKSGWISGTLGTYDEERGYFETGAPIFYNIATKQVTYLPEGSDKLLYLTDENGCDYCTVKGTIAFVYAGTAENGLDLYMVYDVNTGEVVSSAAYNNIRFSDSDRYVAVLGDGKKAFISAEDYDVLGESYDILSDMMNGMYIAGNGTALKLYDAEGNEISDEFEAFDVQNPLTYLNAYDREEAIFFIQDENGKYHLGLVD